MFLLEEEGGVGDHEEAGGRDEGGEEVVAVDPLEADGSSHSVVVDLLHPEGCDSVLLKFQGTSVIHGACCHFNQVLGGTSDRNIKFGTTAINYLLYTTI